MEGCSGSGGLGPRSRCFCGVVHAAMSDARNRGSRIVDLGSRMAAFAQGNPRSTIHDLRSSIFLSFIWMGIGFVPYMFIDYMHRIPSRQTYLASAGLAWLMGAAIVAMKERYAKNYKWAPPVILLMILSHNVAYLW